MTAVQYPPITAGQQTVDGEHGGVLGSAEGQREYSVAVIGHLSQFLKAHSQKIGHYSFRNKAGFPGRGFR
jgi:hypothetical protein